MANNVELWSNLATADMGDPMAIVRRAQRLEADGWHGASLVDSQCLRPDVFVCLSYCAQNTQALQLGTGTSNPATRHASVIAGAAAALQVFSQGRMTYGVGRGDSALAYIGAPPVPLKYFERSLAMIQTYLKGEGVSLEDAASTLGGLPTGFSHLAVAEAPESSKLKWLSKSVAKVPLEVSATGPKVIAAAARHADRIAFAVGGDHERLKWAVGLAREEVERAGRNPDDVQFGAYVPLYPHPDPKVARELSQGMVASQGRFSIINKTIAGPVTEAQRNVLENLATSYDMSNHGQAVSSQVKALDSDFIETFALIGEPDECVDRLLSLVDLGLTRLHLWTAATDSAVGAESYQIVVDQVLPKLRGAVCSDASIGDIS